MKKILLLSLSCAVAVSSFAQTKANKTGSTHFTPVTNITSAGSFISPYPLKNSNVARKTTMSVDTVYYNNNTFDNLITNALLAPAAQSGSLDSGALFGPNALGISAFAENYSIGTLASGHSLNILGVLSLWNGVVNANSTNTIACSIWGIDPNEYSDPNIGANWNIANLPSATTTYSQNINVSSITPGTPITTLFTTPVSVTADFYAGYTPSYTFSQSNGDTVGLMCTPPDSSYINYYYALDNNNDSVALAANVAMINGSWADLAWDLGLDVDYSIVPIVQEIDSTSGVSSITRKNITVFGNYPNPAITNTNIQFSLQNTAAVTVQIMDMQGRAISTIEGGNLAAGQHTINVPTADMPAGDYIYYIHTSDGSKLASHFVVVRQ